MKEIFKLKTKNYCSIGEARHQYRENNLAPTFTKTHMYANVACDSSTRRMKPSNIQTIKHTANQNKEINKQPTTINVQKYIQP